MAKKQPVPTPIALAVWMVYGRAPAINLHAKWYWREIQDGPFRSGQLSLMPL